MLITLRFPIIAFVWVHTLVWFEGGKSKMSYLAVIHHHSMNFSYFQKFWPFWQFCILQNISSPLTRTKPTKLAYFSVSTVGSKHGRNSRHSNEWNIEKVSWVNQNCFKFPIFNVLSHAIKNQTKKMALNPSLMRTRGVFHNIFDISTYLCRY